MKSAFLILVVSLAILAQPVLSEDTNVPLTKKQVMSLVRFGMDSRDLAIRIREHGIDFEPSDDYVEALRKAGAQEAVIQALREVKPRPLSAEQVGKLVAGGVAPERAAMLVKQHGIDFVADEQYLQTLRLAGADDALIAAVREASKAVTAELVVATSPEAEVYLDGELKGHADTQGQLTFKSTPGAHAVKVSLEGKKDFEQSVTLAARQTTKIEAQLADLAGGLRVQTSPGAQIALDGSDRGTADATGRLVVPEVAPGTHRLHVTAPGKKDFWQSVTVLAGQEAGIEARLEDIAPSPGQVRENSKAGLKYAWIPPGTLRLFDPTIDAVTHTVTLNGVDTAQPTTPFHFHWGDGTESVGFFPQTKVYQQSGRTYSIKVMATYPDGSHGSAETTATIP